MNGLRMTIAALAVLAGPVAAQAPEARVVIPGQGQGTVTFFERQGFGGAAITFRTTENNVRIPFQVRSVKAEGVWRICPDTNLRGRCLYANSSYPDSQRDLGLRNAVRSVAPQSAGGGSGGSWIGPVGGQTLRGTAAQFWPAPEIGRQRVEACPNGNGSANCATATAERFCAYAGWRVMKNYMQLTINGRNVLADVLCANR
nr:hypothetical protein [Polymorphobacter sp.]